jgi:hypothetical protein
MRIKLSDADRAHFGCPEWLDVQLGAMRLSEAKALQANGIDPFGLGTMLRGEPMLDADGSPRLDEDGEPLYRLGLETRQVLVWIGLNRAGVRIGLDDLDFEVTAFEIGPDEDEAADEGKAEPAEPTEPATSES